VGLDCSLRLIDFHLQILNVPLTVHKILAIFVLVAAESHLLDGIFLMELIVSNVQVESIPSRIMPPFVRIVKQGSLQLMAHHHVSVVLLDSLAFKLNRFVILAMLELTWRQTPARIFQLVHEMHKIHPTQLPHVWRVLQ
jgi:hypothetical protein